MSNEETTKIDYDTIVLAGASTKGMVTLGALQYGYDNYLFNNIKNFIGTSSGSIICFLLSIGYTPIEIVVYICTHQLIEKMQHFNLVAMLNGGGASSFSSIQEQLEKMTIQKIGYLPNLQDLRKNFGKTFIAVTYNITEERTEYLSPDTHPDLPCITAIKMSSNLPLIFENFKYGPNYYIDGGISDNFAIDLGDKLGNKVIGFLISTEKENFNNCSDSNILEFIYKLMFIPISQAVENKIENASEKCKIIRLKYSQFKFFNFNINSKIKLDMFSKGYEQFSNYQ